MTQVSMTAAACSHSSGPVGFINRFPKPRLSIYAIHWIVKALAAVMILSSSGCITPHLRHAEPGPTMPGSFPMSFPGATDSDSSAKVYIEDFFKDPVLTGLIQQGLVGNQELKILTQNVQMANNEILARKGAYLPFVDIGGGPSLFKTPRFTTDGAVEEQLEVAPGKAFPDPLPNFLVAGNVTWQIDIWRQLRNARDAATMRYLATSEGRNYVVTRLVAEIAENYYTLLALDKRLEVIDQTIELQQQSLDVAEAKKAAGRGTELAVQRFQAEVRKNQSEKLIVKQQIIEVENRINFLVGRYPQPVERSVVDFIELNLDTLSVGVPSQLLQNRPDIRQAEREVVSSGFDVRVARAAFYPTLTLTGGIGYEAFNTRYLFVTPESLVGHVAGELAAPLINRKAIKADFRTANARQLRAIYEYQRTVLNAFTEVVNRVSKVQNYRQSIELKKQQLSSLEESVASASQLFQNARAEYIEVLFAQRDMLEAKTVLIETKSEQLAAIVNAYQALGGGNILSSSAPDPVSLHHWPNTAGLCPTTCIGPPTETVSNVDNEQMPVEVDVPTDYPLPIVPPQ